MNNNISTPFSFIIIAECSTYKSTFPDNARLGVISLLIAHYDIYLKIY